MRVIRGPLSHEGMMSGGVGHPQQQLSPMWREERVGGLNGKRTSGWQVVKGGVASNGVSFMAPLGL